MEVNKILSQSIPNELVSSLINSYTLSLKEYKKESWQYYGNQVGQFIECARRCIEHLVLGTHTPFNSKLSIFNEKTLLTFENASSSIPEEYRIIIPRILYSMYCIRNKRGMIHKNHIDPNKMDSSILLSSEKWVLAEFVRQNSQLGFDKTFELIESIIVKENLIIWDSGELLRILDTKMKSENKIVCLLYFKDKQHEDELIQSIEYSNPSSFRNILSKLHKERLIEYAKPICSLSPKGVQHAENILSAST
ncbi:hypothetical protein BSX36_10475 [Listeria monocytogenes]|uniref:hypothetical protein n=1 Tax=Listeria monocytogenes TaxID=1639 RepID=UPI000D6FDA8B|nr:hypothetical protein [Listeria monocytogenes]EAC6873271.1 hypothetical protein [Listeria monocytogenes]EAC8434881.1 hypothetical protein [Listeria monocytogenes]EAD1934077.1 hypothetical protein [Listeria monocytogenes]EAE8620797.1 hypothetical protein [Listeria monocytogenes]EAE8623380.1 hypothetical protein [Listeria monocytogenes]